MPLRAMTFEACSSTRTKRRSAVRRALRWAIWSLLRADAYRWRGETARMVSCAFAAARAARTWVGALASSVGVRVRRELRIGKRRTSDSIRGRTESMSPSPESAVFAARGCTTTFNILHNIGRRSEAAAVFSFLQRLEASSSDSLVRSFAHIVRCRAAQWEGAVEAGIEASKQAAELFAAMGDLGGTLTEQTNRSGALADIGAFEEAEAVLLDALAQASRAGMNRVVARVGRNLGTVRLGLGRPDEALAVLEPAITASVTGQDVATELWARLCAAQSLMALGRLDDAAREAAGALRLASTLPARRASALAVDASVRLLRGETREALAAAEEAFSLLSVGSGADEGIIRLMYAEALHANGKLPEARIAIRAARDRLLQRAEQITTAHYRESFLRRVPEHSATLRHVAEWVSSDDVH